MEVDYADRKEKSLYLTQIRHLDEHLERCQLRCDELQKQNKHLTSQCKALREDKDDITEYLKHSAAAEDKKAEELMERLEKQQHEAEEHREGVKLQHRQKMEELQEEINKLRSKSKTQVVVLQELKEQLEEQLQLLDSLPTMETLEKQLDREKVEQATALISLKEEVKQERKRIYDERESTVKQYLQMKIPDLLVAERSEHSELLQEVEKLLDNDIELWREKDELETSKRVLNSEIDSLRMNINKVACDISKYKKEAEELTAVKQQLEVKKEQWRTRSECMLGEEEELRQIMASVLEEYSQKEAEVDQLEVEIQQERSRRWQLEADMEEAAAILSHLLSNPEEMTETHRTIQRLLEILESPASQGTGPTPDDPTEEGSQGEKLETSSPEPARAETLNLATDPRFLMVRYRPGDLGFVPRPTWKHRTGSSTRTKRRRRLGQTSGSVDPSGPHQLTDPEGGASADY